MTEISIEPGQDTCVHIAILPCSVHGGARGHGGEVAATGKLVCRDEEARHMWRRWGAGVHFDTAVGNRGKEQ